MRKGQFEVRIPWALESLLSEDQRLHGAVLLSLQEFEPYFRMSGTPFFPEYTGHGLEHVEDVLLSADALIRDEARAPMRPSDAGVLVLATLVHDAAVHLTTDAFVALVRDRTPPAPIEGFGDKPWAAVWEDFMAEARRFDSRKLMQLFGNSDPPRRPPMDPQLMTERDRLLIGEFIRRHHHRLAHEIAVIGVRRRSTQALTLKGVPPDFADLAGVVARSHGMACRDCLPYLREKYDLRAYKGVHAAFLMVLLRVADYLQIQSERAPKQVLQVRDLRSPVSQREWNAHQAVRDIRHTHEDPEALFIDAQPGEVKTFLRLKEWLAGIQHELDTSWAVLGEVYGRYQGLDQLGLVIRRVRSNLDDEETFANCVNYVPRRAALEAADVDLLKLMIKPLYGDRPEIGIRELIQNSVDAVRELREYLGQRPGLKDVHVQEQNADVVVSLEKYDDETCWVKVSDRGIGMTPDLICDYFLRAGACYRCSDAWRERFEDEKGKSRVLRSGRFGIGILAAFLLGDTIEVSTRHVDVPQSQGMEFSATLESEAVELRRVRRDVGTTIRVRVSPEVSRRLSEYAQWTQCSEWDWYCLDNPSLLRIAFFQKGPLGQEYHLPGPQSSLPPMWRRISHEDYEDIHWTYEAQCPDLACNGLIVERGYGFTMPTRKLWEDTRCGLSIMTPNIAVFDRDGKLPLNLQRTGLAREDFPFADTLRDDVIRDALAHALVYGPTEPLVEKGGVAAYLDIPKHPAFRIGDGHHQGGFLVWFSTGTGWSFADYWHTQTLARGSVLLVASYVPHSLVRAMPGVQLPGQRCCFVFGVDFGARGTTDWIRFNIGEFSERFAPGPVRDLAVVGRRMLLPRGLADEMTAPYKIAQHIRSRLHEDLKTPDWVIWRVGDCPDTTELKSIAERCEGISGSDWPGMAEWYLSKTQPDRELSPVARIWKEIIGCPVIPFDPGERRAKLAGAFEKLAPYIEAHEALSAEAAKESRRRKG